jgi:DNA-binding XRE family transcriptional regulator
MNKDVTEKLQVFKQCNEIVTLLIKERKESKFSQEFMADWLGVSRKKLNEFEQGKIDFFLMCHYADKLSIDIELTIKY